MNDQTKHPDVLNVLVLERVDRTKNMARYYVLSVEPTLFAESALVRRWGDRRRRANTNRPSCFLAACADGAQHMARAQAAPRLPTPRLIARTSQLDRAVTTKKGGRPEAALGLGRKRPRRAYTGVNPHRSKIMLRCNNCKRASAVMCRYGWIVDGQRARGSEACSSRIDEE